jgi:hypothetical protein
MKHLKGILFTIAVFFLVVGLMNFDLSLLTVAAFVSVMGLVGLGGESGIR